jgi:hypothetical protein
LPRLAEDCSVAVYRRLVRAYPRRFRLRYEHAIVEAFALELARVRGAASGRAVTWFWVLMLVDLVASVTMTRVWDAWRQLGYSARLICASSGFSAAFAMLIVIPVWALSRYVTDDGTHARMVALSFCVAAVAATVSWALSWLVRMSCGLRRIRGQRVPYASVRRARVLGVVSKILLTTFVAALGAELRRVRASEVFVNQAVSVAFWVSLAAALGALIVSYFALEPLLKVGP